MQGSHSAQECPSFSGHSDASTGYPHQIFFGRGLWHTATPYPLTLVREQTLLCFRHCNAGIEKSWIGAYPCKQSLLTRSMGKWESSLSLWDALLRLIINATDSHLYVAPIHAKCQLLTYQLATSYIVVMTGLPIGKGMNLEVMEASHAAYSGSYTNEYTNR